MRAMQFPVSGIESLNPAARQVTVLRPLPPSEEIPTVSTWSWRTR